MERFKIQFYLGGASNVSGRTLNKIEHNGYNLIVISFLCMVRININLLVFPFHVSVPISGRGDEECDIEKLMHLVFNPQERQVIRVICTTLKGQFDFFKPLVSLQSTNNIA